MRFRRGWARLGGGVAKRADVDVSLILDMCGKCLNICLGLISVGTNAFTDDMHIPPVMATKVKKADVDDTTPSPRQVPASVCERHILFWSDTKRLFV